MYENAKKGFNIFVKEELVIQTVHNVPQKAEEERIHPNSLNGALQ